MRGIAIIRYMLPDIPAYDETWFLMRNDVSPEYVQHMQDNGKRARAALNRALFASLFGVHQTS